MTRASIGKKEPLPFDGLPGSSPAMTRCLHGLHGHAQSVARFRDRPHLPLRLIARRQRNREVLQDMPREAFRLHMGEMQPETHMRAAAERDPCEAMPVALRFLGEAQRIEVV